MYEKFHNSSTVNNSVKHYDSHAFESRETFTSGELEKYSFIDKFCKPSVISLEADDDPFGDIGNDTGGMDDFGSDAGGGEDNPFGDIGEGFDDGGDPFGGDDSGGFDFDSASDDGGDIFGSDDSDSEAAKKAKQKALLLDRAKSIKEDFDISRQIRANFPKKFLELKKITINNINLIERTVLQKVEYEDTLRGLAAEYERMYELLDAYILVMAKKTYEDIFATYVSIHTNMIRLKNLYIKITGLDKDEVEQETSKYANTI